MQSEYIAPWQREYRTQGIPSSVRTKPSESLSAFFKFFQLKNIEWKNAPFLDIGCGKGRNAFYAARQGLQVTAVDFVPEAINFIKEQLTTSETHLLALRLDITTLWPFSESTFDCAYDAFCLKHIIEIPQRQNYLKELHRTLKHEGFFAVSFADIEDGYYSQFLRKNARLSGLITDPGNQIDSILYSYESFCALIEDYFWVIAHTLKTSTSAMYGTPYPRRIHQFILKKKF